MAGGPPCYGDRELHTAFPMPAVVDDDGNDATRAAAGTHARARGHVRGASPSRWVAKSESSSASVLSIQELNRSRRDAETFG